MKHPWLASAYFPTKVILLDDDVSFLKSLNDNLSLRGFYCESYSNSKQLVELLSQRKTALTIFDDCLKSIVGSAFEGEKFGDHPINVDLPGLRHTLFNANRFEIPTVLIVDYAMEPLNGLEVAKQLRQKGFLIKIIMLTGQASPDIGIRGLSEGHIDHFILKSPRQLGDTISRSIRQLQQEYFQEASYTIAKLLSLENHSVLMAPDFLPFFHSIIEEHDIEEYYLLNDKNHFLLLNEEGKLSLLGIFSEEDIDDQYDVITDENLPDSIRDALRAQTGAFFFFATEDLATPPEQWGKFFHHIKPIPSKPGYFYTLFEEVSAYDIPQKEIISFQKFLSAHQKD